MKGRLTGGIFAAFGLMLLILDSRTALTGAQEAVELCISVVIPSLFPFFVLSGMLVGAISGSKFRILRPLEGLLGIPQGSGGLFLTGLLGGYPTGAQAVAQAWKDGQLSWDDGRRMLAFCSNAGPSFLFGILGRSFSHIGFVWLLWGIHILSALLVGALLPRSAATFRKTAPTVNISLPTALRRAVVTTGYVCGWIVLFRVILAFLTRWCLWLVGKDGQVAIFGMLELTNGCCSLNMIDSESLRMMIASGILSFGGICIAMQTVSVTGELGLGWYLPGKILQTSISLALTGICGYLLFREAMHPWIFVLIITGIAAAGAILWLIRRRNEKNCSISPAVGV